MADNASVLNACEPAFAQAWGSMEQARILFGSFIDTAVVIEFHPDDTARVVLEAASFESFASHESASGITNIFMLAERRDRARLIEACRTVRSEGGTAMVDVSWSASPAKASTLPDNFLKTRISIARVGHRAETTLLYLAIQDVSKRKFAERNLARSQYAASLRALFSEIFLLDIDSGESEPVYLNGKPLETDDGEPTECGLHAVFQTVHPDDRQLFWANSSYTHIANELFCEKPQQTITFDLRRTEGDAKYHWATVYITKVANADDRRAVLVCIRNVDEQKEAQRRERELRSKAQTDALTGVYNRGTTEELILATLRGRAEGESSLFAIFDVDNFKAVNDTYGHMMGDDLLRGIAARIRDICRERDIVGRIGGDEFVTLFCGEEMPGIESIQERMRRCMDEISAYSRHLGIDPPVTISAGIVPVDSKETSFHDIFKKADSLLYETKGNGKNGYRLYQP